MARRGWAGEKVDLFRILLDRSFPGRWKRMVADQFLVCGEIIRFNGEVVLIQWLRASRGTEICSIRFRLLLRGKSTEPIFWHPG